MGLSSNQARFLSLTSRQVDLEQRIQQICQRRLRLSSELENVATSYNNSISNRKMFTPATAGINTLSMDGLKKLGYKVINAVTKTEAARSMKPITQIPESAASGYTVIHNAQELVTKMNANLGGNFILEGDIDLSQVSSSFSNSVIGDSMNAFTGTFDGNGYTISNMNINTNGTTTDDIGFFSQLSSTAIVKNVAIENANIIASKSNNVGLLVGDNAAGKISNCYTTGSVSAGMDGTDGAGTNYARIGGLAGTNNGIIDSSFSEADVLGNRAVGGLAGTNGSGGQITNSFATGDVKGTYNIVGGLVGANWTNGSSIDGCYATGNVSSSGTSNGASPAGYVGGLIGDLDGSSGGASVTNSYSTGDVSGNNFIGGFIGIAASSPSFSNNYATGNVTATLTKAGFVANWNGTPTASQNYYQNSETDTNLGTIKGIPAIGWNANWDTSTTPPILKNTVLQGSIAPEKLEDGLRSGVYSLARQADEFTQDPITLNGDKYQEVDWRSTTEIYDELYKGDDVDAENKYDKTIAEINAQDKKLQLEQTSVEVEYKAISSERESVKKILDTNAQSSFKYFS